jgi:hypothetical protein
LFLVAVAVVQTVVAVVLAVIVLLLSGSPLVVVEL